MLVLEKKEYCILRYYRLEHKMKCNVNLGGERLGFGLKGILKGGLGTCRG